MKAANIAKTMSTWNAAKLGMGSQDDMLIRWGPRKEIPGANDVFSETISGGDNGVICVDNSRLEAIGICAQGRRRGINEDVIGVVQNPDGSLLFHLADGFSTRDENFCRVGGADASAGVLRGMALYCCGQQGHFDKMAAEKTQRDLALNNFHRNAGSTYVGALIRQDPEPDLHYMKTDALSIGDSRIIFCDDWKLHMKSFSDNAAYAPAIRGAMQLWSSEYREMLRETLADNPDALKWINGMDSYTPGRLQESLQTFLHYMFPSCMILAYFNGKGIDKRLRFSDDLHEYSTRQKSGQKLFLYSDGVGELFTPIDVMQAFRGKSRPLYDQGYAFAERIMHAQEHGRKIDVGVGNRIEISGKYDNYSFWSIRMK